MQYHSHRYTHTLKLCQTQSLYLDISFSSLLPCTFVFWQYHTQTYTLSHFLMHMLNFRHTGGSLHNVWVCGGVPCERGWRGGRRAVCSAPLACAKLVGWVTNRVGRGGGCGRIEKLRSRGSSGELPIDMQRTVGEINPHHYLLHRHTVAAYILQRSHGSLATFLFCLIPH